MARLLGVLIGAGLAAGVASGLVWMSGPPAEPEGVAVVPPQPAPDPELMLNGRHCEKAAETLGELAEAVTSAGSVRDETLIAVLDRAEDRMSRRAEVPSERLTRTFGELEANLRELRYAIEAEDGVRAAVAETRELIATLDRQCYDLLVNEVES